MHYLLSVIDDQDTPGPDSESGAVGAFNDQLQADGYWVFAGGLESPDAATVTDQVSGRGHDLHRRALRRSRRSTSPASGSSRPLISTSRSELSAAASKACNRKIEVRPFDGIA